MAITGITDDLGELWMVAEHYSVLKEIISNYDEYSNLLEIGTYKGRSAIFFLQSNHKIKINCLDTWDYGGKKEFIENIKRYGVEKRINIIQDKSKNVIKYFNSDELDFIYLDGSHKEEDVYFDLIFCRSILKKNGLVLGDDWQKKSVMNAVNRVIAEKLFCLVWNKKYLFLLSPIK